MVRLADDARDLFTEFAGRHGISVAALLEALARRLPADDQPLSATLLAAVEEARAIDVERRRRG